MGYFCPDCANILVVEPQHDLKNAFQCRACPYKFAIEYRFADRTQFERKQVDDVLGGEGAWDNVDSTDATCPKCEHGRAYYLQIQIRSGDEPMSIFFKCCACGAQWREG
ncbi:hypothetical protein CXG81DRAFT_14491 [Caulochytrium protostelioides]|uniref:DNA-directed RNA polymerase subunit n=1 Tax=Caulochytrium protostelioides TaxID=1555241 RepID=A0A4P9WXF4_9FUNG|nr:DNAdirected RNA polymerases III 12.5 kDa polypeptide putative [Caulochytrium protostelioides]RKO99467.1 hypothetical protein CXG81DRAFT_14491 [Caulochytrium protostelioides]|eukprot:RKO99467.1 hypothetical protein CXG81DRAFT_14491 [Caulochytrium protostelioides]